MTSSPHSEVSERALLHIQHNLALIEKLIQGQAFDDIVADIKTVYAVTRALEIISEASRRLSSVFKTQHPAIDWRRMASAGNIYRHDYEDVIARLIWATAQDALSELRAAIDDEAARIWTQK